MAVPVLQLVDQGVERFTRKAKNPGPEPFALERQRRADRDRWLFPFVHRLGRIAVFGVRQVKLLQQPSHANNLVLTPKAEYTRRLINDVPKIYEPWDLSTVKL